MDNRKLQRLICIVLFVFAFVLYGNTIQNEYALDDEMVTNNDQIRGGISAIPEIFTTNYRITEEYNYGYRPITKSTFALEYQLFGDNPHISHFINVLIYAFTGIFLFLLLVNLLKDYHLFFPMIISLLFMAHPIHTEVVASLKNREELISFLCSLAALRLLFKSVDTFRVLYIIGGILLFIIGFFAKQNAATFVVVIPLTLYFFSQISLPIIHKSQLSINLAVTNIGVPITRLILPFVGLGFYVAGVTLNGYYLIGVISLVFVDQWNSSRRKRRDSSFILSIKNALIIGVCFSLAIFNEVVLKFELIKPLLVFISLPYFLYIRNLIIEMSHGADSRGRFRSNSILLIGFMFFVMAEVILDRSFLLFAFVLLVMELTMSIRVAGQNWKKLFVNPYFIAGLVAMLVTEYVYKILHFQPEEISRGLMFSTYPMLVIYLIYFIDKNMLFSTYLNKLKEFYGRLNAIHISKTVMISLGVLASLAITTYALMVLPTALLPPEHREIFYFENPLVNETGFSDLIGTGFYTLLVYIKLLFLPHPLLFYYGFDHISVVGMSDTWVIISVIIHVMLLGYALMRLRKKHVLSYAILYYLATIFVFSNILFKIPGIIGERLLYMPSLGFCIALAYFIFKIMKLDPKSSLTGSGIKLKLAFMLALIIIPYSVKTIARNYDWKNHLTLYLHDIPNLEKSLYANSLAGSEVLRNINQNPANTSELNENRDKLQLVIKFFNNVLELDANDKHALNNLGTVYYSFFQEYETAIPYFQKALSADSSFAIASFNMAYCLDQTGNSSTAIKYYQRTIKLQPTDIKSISNLANLYHKLGDFSQAVRLNKKITEIDPSSEIPYMNMANYYLQRSDEATAVEYFEKAAALALENYELCLNLSDYFKEQGNSQKALYYSDLARKAGSRIQQ